MKPTLYPLCFSPIHVRRSWSGSLLADYLADEAAEVGLDGTGESWSLVDCGTVQSRVANGPDAGASLHDLVCRYGSSLVGRRQAADAPFPLCARILDVGQTQPLCIHPERRPNPAQPELGPNSKFWYCLEHTDKARIAVGIRQRVTRLQFTRRLNCPELQELLQVYPSRRGDAFFVPPGRVHSIGAGNLVWEIQQVPVDGEPISVLEAGEETGAAAADAGVASVRFEDRQVARISREAGRTVYTRKVPLLHHCSAFCVDEIRLADDLFDRTNGDSFHLLLMVRGRAEVRGEGNCQPLGHGDACCVPADHGDYRITAVDGPADLLRAALVHHV